ncbi:preprotein translocase subunit SecA, partial [Mycobacterium tuberculosis]|nr:preprotein translocase subunit SecA [Mycobacterium tuberculosis]
GKIYTPSITEEDLAEEVGGLGNLTKNRLNAEIQSDIEVFYAQREEELGEEATRELERRVVLSVIDRRWREHLYEMDYLKNGIGLRAMAQRDPLVEYQREGFEMFTTM